LDDPDLRVVDVRWRSRYENGRGISFDDYDGYLEGHIPGAVFASMIGDLSDPNHPIPDMLVQSSSKSPSKPARRSMTISRPVVRCPAIFFLLAAVERSAASRPASTPACFQSGSPELAWIRPCSVRTRFGVQKPR
jgi:hypothetical protein